MFPQPTGLSLSSPSAILLTSGSPYRIYNIDDTADKPQSCSLQPRNPLYNSPLFDPTDMTEPPPSRSIPQEFFFSHASATPHNRRMVVPYRRNLVKIPDQALGSSIRDEPLVLFRFFEFYCRTCEQSWLSPLFRAKDGCFCRICHQFVLPRGLRHSLTPYLGKETCYGKYSCHFCSRGWSSYKSLSNCPDQCFECGTLVYPYYQIAHSVLYQKIHKNCDTTKSALLRSLHLTREEQSASGERQGQDRRIHIQQPSSSRNQPRKMTSISGLSASTKQTMINKKRLHCLNNVPFLQHSPHQVRRQIQLKSCFSEPIIIINT